MSVDAAIAFVGFGEAGGAFAEGLSWARMLAFDREVLDPGERSALRQRADERRVWCCGSLAEALNAAELIFSVVTADQALVAAQDAASLLRPGQFWFDCNSVAPHTKRAAAEAVAASGATYVDVAVLAPVLPMRAAVPLLVAADHESAQAADRLRAVGFTDVTMIDGEIGAASAVKMIRSVMIKGMEALSAECALAATAAGVCDRVIASLDASWPGADWKRRFDYNIDRMIVHGTRRAAEMEQVVATLEALGTGAAMSRATAERQRLSGAIAAHAPDGLDAKVALLRSISKLPGGE